MTHGERRGGGCPFQKKIFFLQEKIFITARPSLMKLYTTPPTILTLVTWVTKSRLAIGSAVTMVSYYNISVLAVSFLL